MSEETSRQMFEGLNAIPWADLRHAYGSADEVPMWLRRLTSSDENVREDAMGELRGAICEQDGICPATAYAVPFLIELLQESTTKGKADILELLADIVESGLLNERVWRHIRRIPFKDAEAEVTKGIPIYVALLDDPDIGIRMQAAHVLSTFSERADEIHPSLMASYERDTAARAKANLVLALGRAKVGAPGENTLFEEIFSRSDAALLRFVAACSLAYRMQEEAPQAIVEFLADVMLNNPDELADYKDLPLGGGGGERADSAATSALRAIGLDRLKFIAPLLLNVLRAVDEKSPFVPAEYLELVRTADMLLAISFPSAALDLDSLSPSSLPLPISTLTGDQRIVLTTLCENRHLWLYPNGKVPQFLEYLGLPQTRHAMAEYLGIEVPPEDRPANNQNKVRRPLGFRSSYLTRIAEAYQDLTIRTYDAAYGQSGQNNDIITVNGAIVFRFPRHPQAVEEMEGKIIILRALQGRLPLPIPNPTYSSRDTHAVGSAFMGYEKLPGKPLYKEMLESVDGEDIVQHLADQLAAFLLALHTTPPDIFPISLPITNNRETWLDLYARIRTALFPFMRPDARDEVAMHFERYLDDPRTLTFTPALIHGDFGPGNILYDAKARAISGIIDFSSAGLGDPATDIAAVLSPAGFGEDFVRRFSGIYPDLDALIQRAHFYVGTFALQEALFGSEQGDNAAFERGIAQYR